MPNIEKHEPGSFCWIELATTDQNAAKIFYEGLFGWGAVDFPMGPGESYTMFNLDGRNAAAAYGLKPEMRAQGIPPHWMVYVAVESADATADKVTAAGGKVTAAPFDVYDFGRMAVLQDPTGAMFCVWQAMKHTGTGIGKVPGTMCWADLDSPDQAAAARTVPPVIQTYPGDTHLVGRRRPADFSTLSPSLNHIFVRMSTMARMSRFSKTTPPRSPLPPTATSTMARARSSARITWLGNSTRKTG